MQKFLHILLQSIPLCNIFVLAVSVSLSISYICMNSTTFFDKHDLYKTNLLYLEMVCCSFLMHDELEVYTKQAAQVHIKLSNDCFYNGHNGNPCHYNQMQ